MRPAQRSRRLHYEADDELTAAGARQLAAALLKAADS